jgi:hypothetical protein
MGLLLGPEIWQIAKFGLQKIGGFTDDDARLNAAVSRAVFGPTDGVGCTSGLERTTDLNQTLHEVRKGPDPFAAWVSNSPRLKNDVGGPRRHAPNSQAIFVVGLRLY